MKANELRILNLFYPMNRACSPNMPIYIAQKVFKIEAFKITSCFSEENFAQVEKMNEIDISDVSEISIDEKWLIKFGFEKCNCINILYEKKAENEFIKYFNVHIEKGKFIISVDNYGMEFKLCEVKYVHQLQNLYFALTGKELELTNNTN